MLNHWVGHIMSKMAGQSGDSVASGKTHIEVDLQSHPVQIAPLDWPAQCGAEACFLGRTRAETHDRFGQLKQLEYQVYVPMALKLLQSIAEQAAQRFGCHRVRIVHAQGTVSPGDASVVIQVATPHRVQSFEACRFLIDTLKEQLPIWKRQIWEHGETFVEGWCPDTGQSPAK